MVAENIHWGVDVNARPKQIVIDWMNSPGHRANILNPSLTHIGVGIALTHQNGYMVLPPSTPPTSWASHQRPLPDRHYAAATLRATSKSSSGMGEARRQVKATGRSPRCST